MKRLLAAVLLALASGQPLFAQFSTDIPGVPRGRIPYLSSSQGRFELDLRAYRIRNEAGDTLAGGVRIGFGKSWRVASSFEFGYDVSLGEVRALRPPQGIEGTAGNASHVDATLVYGIRFGLKWQVLNMLDSDGHGISASVGAAYQPALKPVLVYSKADTSSVSGGYAGKAPEDGGIDSRLATSTAFIAAASFRDGRIEADAALISERAGEPEGVSPVTVYDGFSLAVGIRYRLTSSLGVGLAYWGSGAPPWRDRVAFGLRDSEPDKYGLMVTFGSRLEKGTDIMISSPTGDFSESVSFYFRVR